MKSIIVLVVAVIYDMTECMKLPSNFEKCNRKKGNFNMCLVSAAQSGIRQLSKAVKYLDFPSLSPLNVKYLDVGDGKEVVGFSQQNCEFYGIDQTNFYLFQINFDEKYFNAQAIIPKVVKNCDYVFNGKILLLPIVGTIPTTVSLDNLSIKVKIPYEEQERGGKTLMKFKSPQLTMTPGFINFNFKKFLNGLEQFGGNINTIVNNNWKGIFEDYKSEYEESFGRIVENLMNRFFANISIEEAFD